MTAPSQSPSPAHPIPRVDDNDPGPFKVRDVARGELELVAERRGCEQGVDRSALRSDTDAGATSRGADRAPLQRDGLVYGEDAVTEGRAQVAQPRIDAILSRSCVKEIRPLFDLAYREHRQPERVITHSLEPREDRGVIPNLEEPDRLD